MLHFSGFLRQCNISHFITTRHGGVSLGNYASMNPNSYSGDSPAAYAQNQQHIADEVGLPSSHFFAPTQVHQSVIRTLHTDCLQWTATEKAAALQGVDAVITDLPKVCVVVATADCVPILLYAPDKQVVAAVHAGWRGTVQRIVQKTVHTMQQTYGCDSAQIVAGIGPSIGLQSFEVGNEVVDAFREAEFDLSPIVWQNPDTGNPHIDLWECNRLQLVDAGLLPELIEVAGICTYTNHTDYFSARRLGIQSGRLWSGIFIK